MVAGLFFVRTRRAVMMEITGQASNSKMGIEVLDEKADIQMFDGERRVQIPSYLL